MQSANASGAMTPHPLWRLDQAFLRPYRMTMAFCLTGLLLQSLLLAPIPWLQGLVVDQLMAAESQSSTAVAGALTGLIVLAGGTMLACYLARMGLGWFASRTMSRISLEVVRELTDSLHKKLQRLPLSWFDRQETGQIMARMTSDVGTLMLFLNGGSLQLISDLLLTLGIVASLLLLSWPLALGSLLVLPLFWINQFHWTKKLHRHSRQVQDRTAELYSLLSEKISAVRTVRAFGTARAESARFESTLTGQTRAAKQALQTSSLQSLIAMLIGGLGAAVLFILAACSIQRGDITIGQAVAFVAYLGLLYQPLIRLSQFTAGAAATQAAAERIVELLDETEPAGVETIAHHPPHTQGRLRLENVSFRYRDDSARVLKEIGLDIAPGESIGIWGPSGGGKSTLLALLPRLYELAPGDGRILLDGVDIRRIGEKELRRSIMLVPQQPRLFEGTLRDNLTYANKDSSEVWIRECLEAVDLVDLVASLPEGLETWIGERGASLSGGQRQRVALARALIANPPILLLDDCLSALDAQTSKKVLAALHRLYAGRTRIFASNTLESLSGCDRLIVLSEGELAVAADYDAK